MVCPKTHGFPPFFTKETLSQERFDQVLWNLAYCSIEYYYEVIQKKIIFLLLLLLQKYVISIMRAF